MKKIYFLLTLLSLSYSRANAVQYVAVLPGQEIALNPTDLVEIVGHNENNNLTGYPSINFTGWGSMDLRSASGDYRDDQPSPTKIGMKIIGATMAKANNCTVTLKITQPASNATTSKPVIVPPTSASDTNWNVQLQVSTDLKNWEDVVPGEFLGSDKVRFFRVKSTTGSDE